MAKNKISDFSGTANSNTDIGGISIVGSALPSNFDNALRLLMAYLADMNGGVSPIFDSMTFCDPADNTKKFRFDAGNITTGTNLVIQMDNIATLSGTQTFTGANSFVTQSVGDNSTKAATTAFVAQNAMTLSGAQTLTGLKTVTLGSSFTTDTILN